MSSGQHLSKELYDLIKSIGETRSKQEEDKIIQMDQQTLKTKIAEKNVNPKKMKEYLIRAIYIEMLGHEATFAHIHAVNLAQDKTFSIKRIGYLAASLFLGPEDSLLIMLVATLQRDLSSKSENEVMVALNTISKILCPFIVNAIVESVCKLLNHTNDNIRKKAVMALHKIVKVSISSVSELNDKMKRALCDKDPSVMAASLNIFHEVIKGNPSKYKDLTSSFTVILKQVVEHKLARDYDYHRIPAPWIQIKLLQILSLLGANDQKTSEQIYEIVSMTMKRADDTGINIGFAITYQCVKTIATIYPNSYLLEAATSSLARFLSNEHQFNNNLKFLGINALIAIVAINPKYALEHHLVVVDCLESKDETLKRETLDLLFKMTNTDNVKAIVSKLLNHIKNTSDAHFKKELVTKITSLAERFAPNQEWYINTMSTVLEYGSEHVDNPILINMLKLIDENFSINPQFGEFLIQTYIAQVQKENFPDPIAKLCAWVFGEIGSKIYKESQEWVDDLSDKLLTIIDHSFDDDNTRAWILTALSKLAALDVNTRKSDIQEKFNKYSKSRYLDIQHRSSEYKLLSKYGNSTEIGVDISLSFLDKFVEKALKNGAKPRDADRAIKAKIATLTIQANTSENPTQGGGELRFVYTDTDKNKNKKGDNAGGNDVGIKVASSKWTSEGYKDEKHESNINRLPQSLSAQHSKSISSKDIQEGKIFPGYEKSNTTFTPSTSQPKEDPKLQQKQALAAELFGLGGAKPTTTNTTGTKSNTNDPFNLNYKPTYQPQNKPKTPTTPSTTTTQPTNQTTQSKPTTSSSDFNLLDMDFPTSNTQTTTTTTTQQSNPFSQPKQTTTTTQNPFGTDLLGSFGNTNTFTTTQNTTQQTQNKPSGPSYSGKYGPYNIDVEQYEGQWETLQSEVAENINSNVKSVQDFKKILQKLNFSFVADIEGEVLAAGKKSDTSEVILLYATIPPNGTLQMQYKSVQKPTITTFAIHFKEALKS